MFRITTDTDSQALTLRLEGRLEGPWVTVLAQCFSSALPKLRGRRLRVDLNGVTHVDAGGKAQLAEIYAHDAELVGEDLESKALVSEIQSGRAAGDGESKQTSHEPPATVHDELTQLQRLQVELHDVNEEFANAARPLKGLSEMNDEEREKVAKELRERLARWESVTQQISHVMGAGVVSGQATAKDAEGES
jgi:ABC-type transporter Mla MlaB component